MKQLSPCMEVIAQNKNFFLFQHATNATIFKNAQSKTNKLWH